MACNQCKLTDTGHTSAMVHDARHPPFIQTQGLKFMFKLSPNYATYDIWLDTGFIQQTKILIMHASVAQAHLMIHLLLLIAANSAAAL